MDHTAIDTKEDLDKTGIYVYTARSILNASRITGAQAFPVKIGVSFGAGSTIRRRVQDQEKAARTALNPFEELVLLRAYPCSPEEAKRNEKVLHNILKTDNFHITGDGAGTEWFEVSLDDIDTRVKDLEIAKYHSKEEASLSEIQKTLEKNTVSAVMKETTTRGFLKGYIEDSLGNRTQEKSIRQAWIEYWKIIGENPNFSLKLREFAKEKSFANYIRSSAARKDDHMEISQNVWIVTNLKVEKREELLQRFSKALGFQATIFYSNPEQNNQKPLDFNS